MPPPPPPPSELPPEPLPEEFALSPPFSAALEDSAALEAPSLDALPPVLEPLRGKKWPKPDGLPGGSVQYLLTSGNGARRARQQLRDSASMELELLPFSARRAILGVRRLSGTPPNEGGP